MSDRDENDTAELVVERRDHVVVARLNRPDARNALTGSLIDAIGRTIRAGETDADVHAIVLTGTGDRAFCAGMDLRAFAGGDLAIERGEGLDTYNRLIRGQVDVPLIGAANGTALAGGLELLLACDLIVLADHARLGLPEVKRGLLAAGGGTFIGTRVPLSFALELTLTGDDIDAARAVSLGLANAVVPAADVLRVALQYADRVAANGPLAVRATKELVRLGVADATAAWARLTELQAEVFASEDAKEGAQAFIEKRAPVWRGR